MFWGAYSRLIMWGALYFLASASGAPLRADVTVESAMSDERPLVRSFDCFDTLVGRFHREPQSIFLAMEGSISCPGFAALRAQAEVDASEKSLNGIYAELQKKLDLSDERRDTVRAMEFQEELRTVFPICRNLSLVRDGDLVVTDTYFTEQEVQKILQVVGLTKNVHIVATYDGKSSGKIWEPLQEQYRIECHLGNNKDADVASPGGHGIAGRWFSAAEYSPIEKKMAEANHAEFAKFMRALRLQNPYPPESEAFLVWNEQAELNLPILIFSSQYLDALCKKEKYTTILFSQRGCCHWMPVFQALFPSYRSVGLAASRVVYETPSPQYIEYIRSLIGPGVVIVGGQGTGKSIKNFFRENFSEMPPFLYIASTNDKTPGIMFGRGVELELLNEDRIGTLIDFDQEGPVRAPLEYDCTHVIPAFACVDLGISLLGQYRFEPGDAHGFRTIVGCLNMYRPVFRTYHVAEHQ
jgi:hypothetical protein